MFGLGAMRGERKPFLEVIRNVELHEMFRAAARVARRRAQARGAPRRAGRARARGQAVPLALGGDERGVVMVLHDVTELRRLEGVRTEFVANVRTSSARR